LWWLLRSAPCQYVSFSGCGGQEPIPTLSAPDRTVFLSEVRCIFVCGLKGQQPFCLQTANCKLQFTAACQLLLADFLQKL